MVSLKIVPNIQGWNNSNFKVKKRSYPAYFYLNIILMLQLNKYSTENANYSEILTMSKNLKYKENESNDMLKE